MLKRIDPGQIRLGMFIHRFEGNWFNHPFWWARFQVTDLRQVERVRESVLTGVVIDTDRGIDLDDPAPAAAQPAAPLRKVRLAEPAPRAVPARGLGAPPAEVVRGFGRARSVADRGLKVVAGVFLEMRLGKAVALEDVSPVINAVVGSMQSNPSALTGLLQFQRDHGQIYAHALATSALMIGLGRTIGLDRFDLHTAGLAGLLLDSGIALLPADAPDPMAAEHVALGHRFITDSGLSEAVARTCLEHHERHDGSGWPAGTAGTALSQLGRMAAICDAFDLLTNPIDGSAGIDPAAALNRMQGDCGAFDPVLLAAFVTTMGIWPTGSLVELRTGRLAVVVDQHRDHRDRPLVAVFFDPVSGNAIEPQWIDLATCYGADAIAGPARIDDLPPTMRGPAEASLARVIERVAPAATAPAKPKRTRRKAA